MCRRPFHESPRAIVSPMQKFLYRARDAQGNAVRGKREAESPGALKAVLITEGLVPVSIDKATLSFDIDLPFIGGTVKQDILIVATRTLAAMLGAGLSLSRALSVLERQNQSKALTKAVAAVGRDVSGGSSLNEALAKHPKIFSTLYVAMVKAGEESGKVSEALTVIAGQMERASALSKKVKSAMIYPAIILVAIIGIAILMLIFVVPTLTKTFAELNVELPLATRAIMGASEFMQQNAIVVIAALVALVLGLRQAGKTKRGAELLGVLVLKLPVVAPIVRETYAARTARTLASLLSAGVEVLRALSITRDVVGHPSYAKVIATAEERVRKGEPLAAAFSGSPIYPVLLGDMVAVGEETGSAADMLAQVADFYEREVDLKTKDLSTIIEPFLMLFIGAAVGVFALAMIAPLYSITESIQ